FQTKLRQEDQKKIFSQIPGLNNAVFIRYGQAHRNTYLNSPKVLKEGTLFLKNTKTAVSGQLSGVEGYAESAATGILAALNVIYDLKSEKFNPPPEDTVMGGLFKHLHEQSRNFQPTAANFSIVKTNDIRYRTKKEKRFSIAENSIKSITEWSQKSFFKVLE
ncbi:FAD-dependent oxidoreductase, partial [candidate division WOR-3 bacterium]|nr:FAD-dependent oxidoreductase [candidate division WOR-3 bacterium]